MNFLQGPKWQLALVGICLKINSFDSSKKYLNFSICRLFYGKLIGKEELDTNYHISEKTCNCLIASSLRENTKNKFFLP